MSDRIHLILRINSDRYKNLPSDRCSSPKIGEVFNDVAGFHIVGKDSFLCARASVPKATSVDIINTAAERGYVAEIEKRAIEFA